MTTYFLPAEWHQQDAVMLTWPHKATDWATILDRVEPVFVEISKHICRFERLIIIACDELQRMHIVDLLTNAAISSDHYRIVLAASNDTWARDHGPITLLNEEGQPKLLDFTFNGWGNKFSAGKDNLINGYLFNAPFIHSEKTTVIDFVLEGGALESDGQGTLLTTSTCLCNPNRNPEYTQEQIELTLKDILNVDRVLWLDEGHLEGDDTDAHIDTLARFAPNNTIVYVQCLDSTDSHYESLSRMEQALKTLKTADGESYQLIPLPFTNPCHNEDGDRLPATYANYLIINNAVLVPTYNQEKLDQQALVAISAAYPEREVIGIDCSAIIEQFGSLHCLTMQLPAGTINNDAW